MKLFIDTAELEEVEKAYETGIIEGLTTNPSLIKQAVDERKKGKKKLSLEEYLKQILIIARGTPVSLEVTEVDHKEMIEEGSILFNKFNAVANNVYIKIPICPSLNGRSKQFDGIRAIKALSQARIPVNCTLVFTPEQALMAARAGATFVSLFVGRVDDLLRTKAGLEFKKEDHFPIEGIHKAGMQIHDNGIVSGVDLVRQTAAIFAKYNIRTQILAASIRNARQVREVALAGAHIATIPYSVLQDCAIHEKTIEGMKKFTDDIVSDYAKLGR